MRFSALLLAACFLTRSSVLAETRFVDVNNPQPLTPYTNWATAAKTLQDAADLCVAGDLVLVADGVYSTGGRAAKDGLTNRLYLPRAATVRSVNGPERTIIVGSPDPVGFFGDAAVRCVCLTGGARLEGFTLTNGATTFRDTLYMESWHGGGAFCLPGTLSNCIVTGNAASASGGGVCGGTLLSCTITNNMAADSGGGVAEYTGLWGSRVTLRDCLVISNSAVSEGGGIAGCDVFDTEVIGNQAWEGGGAAGGSYSNCKFEGNSAGNNGGGISGTRYGTTSRVCTFLNNTAGAYGGGAYGSVLESCRLSGNTASYGGGVSESRLQNCLLVGNHAAFGGGAAAEPIEPRTALNTLRNCTVAFNTADVGGGIHEVQALNSIIYFNTAAQVLNCSNSTNLYCCTYPLPIFGSNNIISSPQFVDSANGNFQLQSNSPCINAGANWLVQSSTDLDGNTRIFDGQVDIGAYEYTVQLLTPFQLWLQSYGLPTDGSADYVDSDQDGMNNFQEWACLTNPTNKLSVLQMLPPTRSESGWMIRWKSEVGVNYTLQRALGDVHPLQFVSVATNISGAGGVTTYFDPTNFIAFPAFFRVLVSQ